MWKPEYLITILGYGNPARQDDGLGPHFVELLRERSLSSSFYLESNYQLTIEDVETIALSRQVLFVDATIDQQEPYTLIAIQPESEFSFSSHSITPQQLLGLTKVLFQTTPMSWILGIRGYEFDALIESLSWQAQRNLEQAITDFMKWYQEDGKNLCTWYQQFTGSKPKLSNDNLVKESQRGTINSINR